MMPIRIRRLSWIAAGWLLLAPAGARALAPPVEGAFPEPVRRATRQGLFTPRRDPGGVPLASERGRGARPLSRLQIVQERVPVALVEFPDQSKRFSADTLQWLFFAHRSTGPGSGSVHDYYHDISLGQYDLNGDVLAWRRAANPKDFYAADAFGLNPNLGVGRNAGWLVQEMAIALDSSVDFSRYDLDGDGYVDALWVVHSGQGGEYNTRDATNVWSHQSSLTAWGIPAFKTRTPWPGHPGQFIRINRYIMTPELSAQRPGELNEIGNFCHEHGHTLGLPDLYNTSGPPFAGVGNWDLMAGGVYGGDGHHSNTPTQMGAWSRARLGWLPATNVAAEGPIRISPTETVPASLKIWSEGKSGPEYYLLENREPIGWDQYLPGGGLLVWHADDGIIDGQLSNNAVESYPVFGLRIVEADGLDQLYQGVNRGDAGDPFPGSGRNTVLDEYSAPPSLDNQGQNPHISLRGIRINADLSAQFYATFSPDRWQKPGVVPVTPFAARFGAGAGRSVTYDRQGSLHLLWTDGQPGSQHVYYLERRLGLRWLGAPLQLDHADFAFDPALLADSRGGLLAVWKQVSSGRSQLVSSHRAAGGAWEPVQVLRDGASLGSPPSLAVDSQNRFFCAWSERDSVLKEHVMVQIYRSSQGWESQRTQLSADSVTTQPCLTTDALDRIHIAYLRITGGYRNLMHQLYPFNGGWSYPTGPLAYGTAVAQPVLAPLDSGRIALAWREPRGPSDQIYFRVYDRTAFNSPQGPAAGIAPSSWPFTMFSDQAAHRLLFLWQNSTFQNVTIQYQEAGLAGPWDDSPHTLAGSDSSSAVYPVGVPDPTGGFSVLWVQDGQMRMRSRQGIELAGSPPRIAPIQDSPVYLGQNSPNPMRPRTRIPFEVPSDVFGPGIPVALAAPPPPSGPRAVRLTVHDVSGRRVRTLVDRALLPGRYDADWDGTLQSGSRAPSGVYFYRLDLGAGLVENRKLLLLR